MPRFDVYRNFDLQTRNRVPYLVDVQSDLLKDLQSCVVVPLGREGTLTIFPLAHLTPAISFGDENLVLLTPQLAALTRAELGAPLGSLAGQATHIEAAVDFLIRGF
jgi:toxin CcdB